MTPAATMAAREPNKSPATAIVGASPGDAKRDRRKREGAGVGQQWPASTSSASEPDTRPPATSAGIEKKVSRKPHRTGRSLPASWT